MIMLVNVENFFFYMLFSGFEYLAVLCLIFGFFNMDFKYFRLEIIIGTIIPTAISYFLVILKLDNVVFPVLMIVMVILLKYIFKENIFRAIVIAIAGYVTYIVIQLVIFTALKWLNVLTVSDMGVTFSTKTYILQTICSIFAIVIGMYTKLTNGGFGFAMKKVRGMKGFVYTSIALAITCSLAVLGFYTHASLALMIVMALVFSISIIVIFFLSYKRDVGEFS